MSSPRLPERLYYGGDYNPEQWPEDVWLEDVRLMREAGVNLVSVDIFSWARIQPREGEFDFAWLDRVLDLLHQHEIDVCLATATASPPPWLTKAYPGVLPVDANGTTLFPGSRQHYSPSSEDYRRLAGILVRKLAERYGRHPALRAWHINNEYACHLHECHNEASTVAFRRWLQQRYGTLDALNQAWGTAFWSQIYHDWDEIFTPRKAPYHSNPSQQLDFRRFTSDAFLACYQLEAKILREITPDVPITTNFMAFHRPLDHWKWAPEVDFTAWDSYPDPLDEAAGRHWAAIGHDLTRSLKPDRPWVLMEQATSAVNWRPVNRPKRPGLMRVHSLQAVARGADGVMFFQWRASRAGAEKFHSALLPHTAHETSRVFAEVRTLGAELSRLQVLAGSRPLPASVAIVFDWENWWACDLESKPGVVDCVGWVRRLHRWFYEHNIGVDFVPPGGDLKGYNLVIAPLLYLLRREHAQNLEDYVSAGGTLLATYFSGIVDENEHIVLGGYPAWLRRVLGLRVEEWCPYPAGQHNFITFADGAPATAVQHWCDLLETEGAEVLATYTQDFIAGRPALTRHRFAKGTAYYLGTEPTETGMSAVLQPMVDAAAVAPVLKTPAGVEATLRTRGNERFLFLLNHGDHAVDVSIRSWAGVELLGNRSVEGSVSLSPLGVAVIRLDAPTTVR